MVGKGYKTISKSFRLFLFYYNDELEGNKTVNPIVHDYQIDLVIVWNVIKE